MKKTSIAKIVGILLVNVLAIVMIFVLTEDKKDSKRTQSEEVLIVEENVEEVEENIDTIESVESEEVVQEEESTVECCEEENEEGEILVEPLSTYVENLE